MRGAEALAACPDIVLVQVPTANGKADLPTQDLMLACKIAKMDVGVENAYEADRFVHPSLVTKRDCYGTPRQVDWRGFHKSLPYPELHAPGQFQVEPQCIIMV